MTTITGTLLSAAGAGVTGITVTARLVASSELLTTGGQVIRVASTISTTGGAWSLTLTPISALAYPTGAYYRVEADGRRWTITVPATGTHELGTVLVVPPEERDELGLTQVGADARYLALAGGTLTGALILSGAPTVALHAATKAYVDSITGAGTPSGTVVAETGFGQASVAGASADYSRGDHTHGTPTAPTAASVGADPTGTAAASTTTHVAAADPHGDRAYAAGLVTAEATTRASADATLTTAVNARLVAASNLSDVASVATARTNLGLGSAALLPALVVRRGYITSGDVSTNTASAWALLTGTAVAIAAAAGDYVELNLAFMRNPGNAFLDIAIKVSGAAVRYWSNGTATPATEGAPWLYIDPAGFRTAPGPWGLQVASGDLEGGNVTFQIAAKGTTGTVYASTAYPLYWNLKNLGPVDYA